MSSHVDERLQALRLSLDEDGRRPLDGVQFPLADYSTQCQYISMVRRYLEAPNKFHLGERTVLVLTPKVGQKSYGSEKRFISPPPSALLLGLSWCSQSVPRPGFSDIKVNKPALTISVTGENNPAQATVPEWTNERGIRIPTSTVDGIGGIVAGRGVAKQLYISNVDDRVKVVNTVVEVTDGQDSSRLIGRFESQPIKVVSKPSKKRQGPGRANERKSILW